MRVKRLSNKEIRSLNKEIVNFNISFKKGSEVFLVEENKNKLVVFNKNAVFFYFNNRIVPTLKAVLSDKDLENLIPKVVVDKGAVKFVLNGADIMRPGIKRISSFRKDSFVIVQDELGNILSLSLVLFDSEDIKKMEGGAMLKNIHHLKDYIWNFQLR